MAKRRRTLIEFMTPEKQTSLPRLYTPDLVDSEEHAHKCQYLEIGHYEGDRNDAVASMLYLALAGCSASSRHECPKEKNRGIIDRNCWTQGKREEHVSPQINIDGDV